jgi:hypothetical protein
MRITIGQLRRLIRESLGGSQPEESYSIELLDDPHWNTPSVYVADDIKEKIKKWAIDMKLYTK